MVVIGFLNRRLRSSFRNDSLVPVVISNVREKSYYCVLQVLIVLIGFLNRRFAPHVEMTLWFQLSFRTHVRNLKPPHDSKTPNSN